MCTQADWSGVAFDTLEWRATNTYILRGLDDVQTLLDDQIVKTQGMRASPYIGPFEERVRLWEAKLNLTQEILDEWLKCQQVTPNLTQCSFCPHSLPILSVHLECHPIPSSKTL